jgi:hypothetical protein
MSREAMKQSEALRLADALDELDRQFSRNGLCGDAAAELRRLHEVNQDLLKALHEALETEQEPVAWMHTTGTGHRYFRKKPQDKVFNPQPVFTAPQKKPWVELTDEEIYATYDEAVSLVNATWDNGFGTVGLMFPIAFYELLEAKLKEKNI